ncbi:RNA-dependent RNA polymerase [Khurdun virus]|uniref:RNA-directed RNA polymerase L n=1 Tax=Khurdun virus TaxID=1471047 RepID=W8PCV8_9VIRU|nr:RNA-dependent RNA polymerase [Khurdun virus]AHL27166.1 RNA-dependent RNA polymerase [Khurdun virus]
MFQIQERITQLQRRQQHLHNGTIAAELLSDVYMLRHDVVGMLICDAINIPYKDDCPFDEIVNDVEAYVGYKLDIKQKNYSPDNYLLDNRRLVIIDYKCTTSNQYIADTYNKYNEAFRELADRAHLELVVAVINVNHRTRQVESTTHLFDNELLAIDTYNQELNTLCTIGDEITRDWETDDDFLAGRAFGGQKSTPCWTDRDVDLFENDEFVKFLQSLPSKYQDILLMNMENNPSKITEWDAKLNRTMEMLKADYNREIKEMADKLFLEKKSKEPTTKEIEEGWLGLEAAMREKYDLTLEYEKQKPSAHFVWAPQREETKIINTNTRKIIYLIKALKMIQPQNEYQKLFRDLANRIDFTDHVEEYETFIREKKNGSCKLQKKQIGKADVYWEGQFSISQMEGRKLLLKEAGVGAHIPFKRKNPEDADTSRPKMLNPFNELLCIKAESQFETAKMILSRKSPEIYTHNVIEHYKEKIKSCNHETEAMVDDITKSDFFRCLMDISTLLKGALSTSLASKKDSIRVICCANPNVFLITYPSTDIKTSGSTLCYSVIALHKEQIPDFGSTAEKVCIGDSYITISRPMRLDKERVKRLIESPGLFILLTILMSEYCNSTLQDVMAFTFFCSTSITKSFMTLTEPARYILMNSSAIISDVKSYLSEKFDPMTKTFFSIYCFKKLQTASLNVHNSFKSINPATVKMSDTEIIHSGVESALDIPCVWFDGKSTLKGYINHAYLPFYTNSKGLHNPHHNIIELTKVPLEIERNLPKDSFWGKGSKQRVDLNVFIYALAKHFIRLRKVNPNLRETVERTNMFKENIVKISTMTSSKSALVIGDFSDLKKSNKEKKKINSLSIRKEETNEGEQQKFIEENLCYQHCDYDDVKNYVPNYIDHTTIPVFDILYRTAKEQDIDRPFIDLAFDSIRNHNQYYFTLFPKDQRTAKDREIYEGEMQAKLALYVLERIYKTYSKGDINEMISEPGDRKMKIMEENKNTMLRWIASQSQNGKQCSLLEINADMSKWSAEDITSKYIFVIALDPSLYPNEKKHLILFLCKYIKKKLIIPDSAIKNIMDQKKEYDNCLIREATADLTTNVVEITQNWLQGNLNYTSSFVHSIAMAVYNEVITEAASRNESICKVISMVHSDDNQTSICATQGAIKDTEWAKFCSDTISEVMSRFGFQVNKKKTYASHIIKEFVSMHNLAGESFSVYGRFLLPCISNCAFMGPYEDISARLSSIQTALRHGCPPSIAMVGIMMSTWATYDTYNMLPGQANDPEKILNRKRFDLPLEIGGFPDMDLAVFELLGVEAHDINLLCGIIKKYSNDPFGNYLINEVELTKPLENYDEWLMKYYLIFSVGEITDKDAIVGETFEMKQRSLITPRRFTTYRKIKKLESYNDYVVELANDQCETLFEFIENHQHLLIVKAEDSEEYKKSIIYRFNSRKFRESISVQSSVQLFLEQVLFSHRNCIDIDFLEHHSKLIEEEQITETGLTGKITIVDAFNKLNEKVQSTTITQAGMQTVLKYKTQTDPMIATLINAQRMFHAGQSLEPLSLKCSTIPNFRTIKATNNSPAEILMYYINNRVNDKDIILLEQDKEYLLDFLKESGLLISHEMRLANASTRKEKLSERTRFLQSCYVYLTSSASKNKITLIQRKCYNLMEFLTTVFGATRIDGVFITTIFHKPIILQSVKGRAAKTRFTTSNQALTLFKSLAYFADKFIAASSRRSFCQAIIDDFFFNGMKVKDLLDIAIEERDVRKEILPFLYRMKLTTSEMLRDAIVLTRKPKANWHVPQISRTPARGPFSVTYETDDTTLTVTGQDNLLEFAEAHSIELKPSRLKDIFDRMSHDLDMDEFRTYPGKLDSGYFIVGRRFKRKWNLTIKRDLENLSNINVKVFCKADFHIRELVKVDMFRIHELNKFTDTMTKIEIETDRTLIMRRGNPRLLTALAGPDLTVSNISLNKLLESPALLSNRMRDDESAIADIINIFNCKGETITEFDFFGDEEMLDFVDIPFELNIPSGAQNLEGRKIKYKDDLHSKFIYAGKKLTDELKLRFDFTEEDAIAYSTISGIIDFLKINSWCTHFQSAVHIAASVNGFDKIYHSGIHDSFLTLKGLDYEKVIKLCNRISMIKNQKTYWNSVISKVMNTIVQKCHKELAQQATSSESSLLDMFK